MKRFRINEAEQIIIFARYKSEIIEKQRYFGYKSLQDIKRHFLENLPFEFKNKGRRIELTIFNATKNEYRYINCFS
jgi:hypothetical protein